MTPKFNAKPHLFMPGHTVIAIIKKFNGYALAQEELDLLINQFIELNSDKVIKVGESALIPILDRIAT